MAFYSLNMCFYANNIRPIHRKHTHSHKNARTHARKNKHSIQVKPHTVIASSNYSEHMDVECDMESRARSLECVYIKTTKSFVKCVDDESFRFWLNFYFVVALFCFASFLFHIYIWMLPFNHFPSSHCNYGPY